MAATNTTWRPSAPTSGCAPSLLANAAQVHLLGQPAVQIQVRTAPGFGPAPVTAGALKINDYIGAIGAIAAAAPAAAATEGATTSLNLTVSAAERVQKVQGDMVKGGDARGIPPRGKPV